MSVTQDQQYRPITLEETREGDGLSARIYRDHVRNVNWYKAYAAPRKIAEYHNYAPDQLTHAGAGNETLITQSFAPARVGYGGLTFVVWAYKQAAGADITVRLYSSDVPYTGDNDPFDPLLLANVEIGSVIVTGAGAPNADFYEGTLDLNRLRNQTTHLILTHETAAGGPDLHFGECVVWYTPLT